MTESNEHIRISIRLSPQARHALEEIMMLGGLRTLQDAVRRAISDELFLQKERKNGWSVLLKKGNEFREITWPVL
jgi:hypothetical protein